MELKIKLETDTMDRVFVFGGRPELVLTPKATALVTTVGVKLTALRKWGSGQITGGQDFHDGVSTRRFLAAEIRSTLNDMAQLAKSMEVEGQVGLSDQFPHPKYQGFEPLLLTAEGFADRAEPIAVQFTDRGMPAAFVTDLRAKITAFRGATDDKHGGKADRSAGTAGMVATAKEGMKAVRALRPIMRVILKSNPPLLAAWNLAARVERAPSSKAEAPAAPAVPAAPPAPAPAS